MDDKGLEYFRYRRLRPDKEDIRLLEIEDASGGADDTVICSLRHCKVSDLKDVYVNEGAWKKPYEAMSYAWGPTFPDGSHLTDMIFCDGLPLCVTATLNQGLKRYRETRKHRYNGTRPCKLLWVDAICINQADPEDRSTQVRKMDVIYQSSQSTVIWLGEPGSVDFHASVGEWLRVCQSNDNPTFDEVSSSRQIWSVLLSLPWFNRRWVIQEYALALEKTFLLGNLSIKPSWVFKTLLTLDIQSDLAIFRHGDLTLVKTDGKKNDIENDRVLSETLQRSLLARLHQFGSTAYSDPRDSIYALHGISLDRHLFVVDYSRSLRQTHLEVASVYVQNRVTFLPYIVSTMRYERNAGYPSWLVDWSQAQSSDMDRLSEYRTIYKMVNSRRTGITARSWSKFSPQIDIDGSLTIRAVLLRATDPRQNRLFINYCLHRYNDRDYMGDWDALMKRSYMGFAVCLLKHTRVAFGLRRKKFAGGDNVFELVEVLSALEANEEWWEDIMQDHTEIKVTLV